MKITEGVILKVEHDLLVSQILSDCPDEDRAAMAMYIAGVNDMAQAVIEAMEGEKNDHGSNESIRKRAQ